MMGVWLVTSDLDRRALGLEAALAAVLCKEVDSSVDSSVEDPINPRQQYWLQQCQCQSADVRAMRG